MSDAANTEPPPPPRFVKLDALVVIAGGICFGIGIWFAVKPVDITPAVAGLIGLGVLLVAWPVISLKITKFTIGALTVELAQLRQELNGVKAKAGSLQGAVDSVVDRIPVKATPKEEVRLDAKAGLAGADDSDDPRAGKFGGSDHANGRMLLAKITPVNAKNSWCRVLMTVKAEPGNPPLKGTVKFFLHPTIRLSPREIPVINGQAETEFYSYGAFTVGAEADDGATRLELDLADPKYGGLPPWITS